jgi:hypothetical protein
MKTNSSARSQNDVCKAMKNYKFRRYFSLGVIVLASTTLLSAVSLAKEPPIRPARSSESQAPEQTDMDALMKRSRVRQAEEDRAFNKRAAELKRATSGVCSNC